MLTARFLRTSDLTEILRLEERKWDSDQAADADSIVARLACYPDLCIGCFDEETGEMCASLFMKPIHAHEVFEKSTWHELACPEPPASAESYTSLFGISLSSISQTAVDEIMKFFWPYALKQGVRRIYLGSPMPGLRNWIAEHPSGDPLEYAATQKNNLPIDPQLRYYNKRGFKHLVSVKRNYFPHFASMNHAAILCGKVPLSGLAPLWKNVPLGWLLGMRGHLFSCL